MSPEGNAIYLNQRHRDLFGDNAPELLGTGWHSIVHPDDAAACKAALEHALRDRTRFHRRVRVKSWQGEWRWLDAYVPADVVHPGSTTEWLTDDELWVLQSENVWFKPLMLNVSQGYFVNLLRVRKSGILSCHRHSGPVHAFVLKGRWYCLEHDWIAEVGAYAFEPPGRFISCMCPTTTPK